VLGYLLGPTRRQPAQAWIQLRPLGKLPRGGDAAGHNENPFHVPWDGPPRRSPAGSDDSRASNFKCWRSTARISAAPSLVRTLALFMCPCHGGAYYEDGSRHPGAAALARGPAAAMLSGLPQHLLHRWVVHSSPATAHTHRSMLVHPTVAWVLFVGSTWVWHTPALYEQALASEAGTMRSTPAFS